MNWDVGSGIKSSSVELGLGYPILSILTIVPIQYLIPPTKLSYLPIHCHLIEIRGLDNRTEHINDTDYQKQTDLLPFYSFAL